MDCNIPSAISIILFDFILSIRFDLNLEFLDFPVLLRHLSTHVVHLLVELAQLMLKIIILGIAHGDDAAPRPEFLFQKQSLQQIYDRVLICLRSFCEVS